MRTPEWLLWQEAMKAELRTLEDRGVVEWGVLPPGKRAIGNVWNFRVKTNADGSFQKRKARLCAQGFSQRPGEFGDVFAPTADLSTVRTALVIAQQMDMKLYQFDISAAYLHADLEEEVWMRPPAGIQGSPPGLACRLRKALYGLRQAGRAWADHFARILKGLGFHRFVSDGVVFRRTQKDSDIILVIFTDDVLAASSSHAAYLDLLAELRSHLELVDNGPYHFFLGNEYIQRDGRSYISQEGYVEALLARHGMSAANPSSLPYGTEQLTARSDAEDRQATKRRKHTKRSSASCCGWRATPDRTSPSVSPRSGSTPPTLRRGTRRMQNAYCATCAGPAPRACKSARPRPFPSRSGSTPTTPTVRRAGGR